jgi:hypothetical protein
MESKGGACLIEAQRKGNFREYLTKKSKKDCCCRDSNLLARGVPPETRFCTVLLYVIATTNFAPYFYTVLRIAASSTYTKVRRACNYAYDFLVWNNTEYRYDPPPPVQYRAV